MPHLNQRQLEAFRAVVESGSTVAASRLLNVSQPAISRSLKLLEEQVGFALFERSATGLCPTQDGQALYHEVAMVFRQLSRAGAIAGRIARADHGEVRVAAFPALAASVLPAIVAQFMIGHPHVRVSLYGSGWRQIVDGLTAQKLDIALTLRCSDSPMIDSTLLGRYRQVCVLGPGHPLAGAPSVDLKELANHEVVMLDTDDGSADPLLLSLAEHRVTVRSPIKVSLAYSACQFVALGRGIAIVDDFVARQFQHCLHIRPLVQDLWFGCWLSKPRSLAASSTVQTFTDLLRSAALELLSQTPMRSDPPTN
jgi:DNA-binding transcriptional LysR family regulator